MIIHAEDHWVTVAAVDEELWYLDSLRPHKPLTPYVIRQLLQLFATRVQNDGKLHLMIRPTTPQKNNSDCGVYAATYAMELVVGNIKGIQASFDETLMRSHLEELFINKRCTPFPKRDQRNTGRRRKSIQHVGC